MEETIKNEKKEQGSAVVEAVILLPVCIVIVLALYYASIFMCQKANLQANLQTALLYYGSTYDTFIDVDQTMTFSLSDGTDSAKGNSWQGAEHALFAYRFFGMSFDEGDFDRLFHSMAGHMFFSTGKSIQVSAKSTNYVVYRKITAEATQTVKPAISFSLIGIDDTMVLSAGAELVISDQDELIRNVDMVFDIVSRTSFGKKVSEMVGKCVELYNTFKEKFGV